MVERGEIDCIIVKDLSRLGRESIGAGMFIIYGISVASHGKEVQQVDLWLIAHLGIISAFRIIHGTGCGQEPVPVKQEEAFMLGDYLLHIAAYRAPHPPKSVQELCDGIRHEGEPWIEERQDAVLIMELQPPEAAVIYGTDDCCYVDGLLQVREMLLQSAAHPIGLLADIIYSSDFHYVIQDRVD